MCVLNYFVCVFFFVVWCCRISSWDFGWIWLWAFDVCVLILLLQWITTNALFSCFSTTSRGWHSFRSNQISCQNVLTLSSLNSTQSLSFSNWVIALQTSLHFFLFHEQKWPRFYSDLCIFDLSISVSFLHNIFSVSFFFRFG